MKIVLSKIQILILRKFKNKNSKIHMNLKKNKILIKQNVAIQLKLIKKITI